VPNTRRDESADDAVFERLSTVIASSPQRLSIMDTIQQCLELVPIPYLSAVFKLFRVIYATVEQVQSGNEQLRVLASCVSQLLVTLNAEHALGKRLLSPSTSATLDNMTKCVLQYHN
jgi:hypothetical protein